MRLFLLLSAYCLLLALIAAGVMSANQAKASDRLHITDYDAHIERGALRWIPEYDWTWLRAQCYQESRFRPRAVSPAGARGLCQFMPGTWADASRAIGVRDVYSARENAYAAGWYMRRMAAIWTSERTEYERLELAQASYNAGAGNIIQAQRVCDGARNWQLIRTCLPEVTGHHSAETIQYVERIAHWFEIQQPERTRCLPGWH